MESRGAGVWLWVGVGLVLPVAMAVVPSCGDEESAPTGAATSGTGTFSAGAVGGGATGGAGGAGGAGEYCTFSCDIDDPPVQSGELPEEISLILDNCRRCHIDQAAPAPAPPLQKGPFPLLSYQDTQVIYGGRPLYVSMKSAVESLYMPKQPPELGDDLEPLLDWLCACAPPAAGGAGGTGGAGGVGGAGGAGGTGGT